MHVVDTERAVGEAALQVERIRLLLEAELHARDLSNTAMELALGKGRAVRDMLCAFQQQIERRGAKQIDPQTLDALGRGLALMERWAGLNQRQVEGLRQLHESRAQAMRVVDGLTREVQQQVDMAEEFKRLGAELDKVRARLG